jgi:hypothetical protein
MQPPKSILYGFNNCNGYGVPSSGSVVEGQSSVAAVSRQRVSAEWSQRRVSGNLGIALTDDVQRQGSFVLACSITTSSMKLMWMEAVNG